MKKTKFNLIEDEVKSVTACGVPAKALKKLCRKLKFPIAKMNKGLQGQTMQLIDGEVYIYPYDIIRILQGKPNYD